MKYLVRIIICQALLFICMPMAAIERPESDSWLRFSENHTNKTAEVTGHSHGELGCKTHKNVSLPTYHIPTVNETRYKVIGIYGEAFRSCSNIVSVEISGGYEKIGYAAFIDCENLTKFSWTGGSEGSGEYFKILDGILYYNLDPWNSYNSHSWQAFCYPAGKTDKEFQIPDDCKSIGKYSFYKNRHLQHIILHDKIEKIEEYSFYGCKELTSVTIPGSVKKIGANAFNSCAKLKNLTIEDGVEIIDNNAFEGCTSLESITIPASVTQINERAFAKCPNLKTITLQAGVRKFGTDVFDGCKNLNEVRIVDLAGWCQSDFATPLSNPAYISKQLNYIGKVITDLVIPTDVTKIGQNAFYGYEPLKTVTFKENVSSISEGAFYGCNNLENVDISNLASWCNINFTSEESNPLTYAKKMSLNGDVISILNIPEDVSQIKKYTFNNGNFTQIWLPSSVNKIADAAFKGVSPETIRCYNTTPPQIVNTAFTDYSATLLVPAESRITYWSHAVWGLFSKLKDLPISVSSISLNPSNVNGKEGEQIQITVTVLPEDATNKEIVWSSSNENVATVNDSGLISLIGNGTAVITVSASDESGVSAECAVIVTETTGINDILTDKSSYVKIFNLNGILVYEGVYAEANLAPDYYIVVGDGKSIKVKVK